MGRRVSRNNLYYFNKLGWKITDNKSNVALEGNNVDGLLVSLFGEVAVAA